MKKNPYFVLTTIAGSLLLILTALAAVAPVMTKGYLPLGGTDFVQMAAVLLTAIAIAALIDMGNRN